MKKNKTVVTKTGNELRIDGLPVKDANSNLLVNITKADILGSSKKDPTNCAAARAIKREYKCKEVKVFLTRTYVKAPKAKTWTRYMTPGSITKEIISFDRGSSFEDGEYQLRSPAESQKLGNYRGSSTPKTGAKKQHHHITANVRSYRVSK